MLLIFDTFFPVSTNIQWVCLSIASFPICENGWFGHNFVQCINFHNKRAYNALYKCLSFKWETRTKHFELRVFILNITIWNMLTNSFVLNNVYSKLVDLYDTNWWPLSKFENRENDLWMDGQSCVQVWKWTLSILILKKAPVQNGMKN